MFKIIEKTGESDETCSSNKSQDTSKSIFLKTFEGSSYSHIVKVKRQSDEVINKLQGQLKKLELMNVKHIRTSENFKAKASNLEIVRKDNKQLKNALMEKQVEDLISLEIKKSKILLNRSISKGNLVQSKESVIKRNRNNNHSVRVERAMHENFIKERERSQLTENKQTMRKLKTTKNRGSTPNSMKENFEFEDVLLKELKNQQNLISQLEVSLKQQLMISSEINKRKC
jgi:hypothetical protein